MPTVPLPENASLEHLKSQAKLVQDLVRSADDGAIDLVKEFHPRADKIGSSPAELERFKRTDAHLVVARLYGFASWMRLRDHLELLDRFARPDTADLEPTEDADRFAAMGSVTYSGIDPHERLDQAHLMLAVHPELAESTVPAMATAGNHRLMVDWVSHNPDLVNEPCGPNRWPPLLYCAYSRVVVSGGELSTLETARVLLDGGADPNAGFLWRGLVPPFTALTGAIGGGERDQSPHDDAAAFARLLLEKGADPNDGQALYNNGLAGTAHDDPSHLELLVEFGLGRDLAGPWYERFGDRLTAPAELLYDELEVAAHRGLPKRMKFLVGLGLDLTRGVGRSGKTAVHLASRKGHQDVLAVLAEAGVDIP